MKLCSNQSIPLEYLKGACIFLSDEDEGRYIKDVCVDLEKHSIILIDDNGNGMYWEEKVTFNFKLSWELFLYLGKGYFVVDLCSRRNEYHIRFL